MAAGQAHQAPDRGPRRRGRRRAGVWLHAAAIAGGHFVQGTSIPGVAQRTGATTYYLEIVPGAGARHRHIGRAARAGAQRGARRGRPAGRQRAAGGDPRHRRPASSRPTARCSSPRRPACSPSTRRRPWATAGSMQERMLSLARALLAPRRRRRFCRASPRQPEPAQCRAAGRDCRHRRAADRRPRPSAPPSAREGKAVDANLRGFEAGLERATRRLAARWRQTLRSAVIAGRTSRARRLTPTLAAFPAEAHAVLAEASSASPTTRTRAYAERYLARVQPLRRPARRRRRLHRASSPATSPCA